jgi:uncharacterized iron-regulated protein
MRRFFSMTGAVGSAIGLAAGLLAGCATETDGLRLDPIPTLGQAQVLLLGEQHDAPRHHQWHAQTVTALAGQGRLAALTLEMADAGASTEGLGPAAPEAAVREALAWNEPAWPWAAYGPAVMAAVRAGAVVRGANLPRARMRAAMAETALDAALPAAALARQREAIRAGHCDLLPEAQVAPMTRIQLARDRQMAEVVAASVQPARVVVLLAGGGHVDPAIGVPRWLDASGLRPEAVAAVRWPAQPPARDYCADLRRQWAPAAPASLPAASPASAARPN